MKRIAWLLVGFLIFCAVGAPLGLAATGSISGPNDIIAQSNFSLEGQQIKFLISELERTIDILSQEPMIPPNAGAGLLKKDKLTSWFDLERPEPQGIYYQVLGLPVPKGLKLNRTKSEFFRMNIQERHNLIKNLEPILADLRRKILFPVVVVPSPAAPVAPTPALTDLRGPVAPAPVPSTPVPLAPAPMVSPPILSSPVLSPPVNQAQSNNLPALALNGPPSLEYLMGAVQSWRQFYRDVFGMDVDLSKLWIPEYQHGFDRLIVVAKGMNDTRTYNECAKRFRCSYELPHGGDMGSCASNRVATESYAIWVRDRVEADKENKDKSADMLASENHQGITLTERLILELRYFGETGKHLDINGETLCSGSRYLGGEVPHVHWFHAGLGVHSRPSSHIYGNVRARSVIGFKTLSATNSVPAAIVVASPAPPRIESGIIGPVGAKIAAQPVNSKSASSSPVVDVASQLQSWQQFYRDVFGMNMDLSKLWIPKHQNGFDRLIVVVKDITDKRAYDACVAKFPCRIYAHSSDQTFLTNDRVAVETYAIWIRDRTEADEENKNKSVNVLMGEKHQGITLIERLMLELKYFSETGKHLDTRHFTLCSGSFLSNGLIPYVGWFESRLKVLYCDPSYAREYLRSRSVIF